MNAGGRVWYLQCCCSTGRFWLPQATHPALTAVPCALCLAQDSRHPSCTEVLQLLLSFYALPDSELRTKEMALQVRARACVCACVLGHVRALGCVHVHVHTFLGRARGQVYSNNGAVQVHVQDGGPVPASGR